MARETKQERIVRGMFDQMTEHLHELKSLATNPATKELDLERWVQSVIRNCLGFTPTNGYTIRAQETRGKLRPDLMIVKDEKIICVVEVKKLGFDLRKSDFRSGKLQLSEYLNTLGDVRFGILSNGYEWKLFDFSDRNVGGVEVVSFDLRNDSEEVDVQKKGVEDVSWSFVDIHETAFAAGNWVEFAREATAFSPESLAKAILSIDTVKYVARIIKGEFDYKANTEVLIEKIQALLENGLDDLVPGWGETKQAEMHKFVTSQKRAHRRKRSSGGNHKDPKPGETVTTPDASSAQSTPATAVEQKPGDKAA